MRAQVQLLPDNRRLHLQDGPIDLIVEAFGAPATVKNAYDAAILRFATVLDELCGELPLLRRQAAFGNSHPGGAVARRMFDAVLPYCQHIFITPMAAVAGAVAEEILHAMTAVAQLDRAYVNNGGDIALHLAPGSSFTTAMVDSPDSPAIFGTALITAAQPIRGIATSGWRGRSFSRGIADAVTVLAETAAKADAAATVVANAVDLPGHSSIARVPARDLAPDSDLGQIPVTREVGKLTAHEIATALEAGATVARALASQRLLHSAALHLRGENRVVEFDDRTITCSRAETAALRRPMESNLDPWSLHA